MSHLHLGTIVHETLLHIMTLPILLPIPRVHLHTVRSWWYYARVLVNVVVLLLFKGQPLLLLLPLRLQVLYLRIELIDAVVAPKIVTLNFRLLSIRT